MIASCYLINNSNNNSKEKAVEMSVAELCAQTKATLAKSTACLSASRRLLASLPPSTSSSSSSSSSKQKPIFYENLNSCACHLAHSMCCKDLIFFSVFVTFQIFLPLPWRSNTRRSMDKKIWNLKSKIYFRTKNLDINVQYIDIDIQYIGIIHQYIGFEN